MTTTVPRAAPPVTDPYAPLHHLASLPAHHPARPAIRDQAIVAWLPLANDLARRFAGRGEPLQDLIQTATVGLIKAVDRFDVTRGTDFPAFAVPTIIGEVKRYFRDQSWDLHVPRRLQELRRAIGLSSERLSQRLGRTPTVAEIAADLTVTERDIQDGRRVAGAYTTISLDAPASGCDEPGATLGDLLGGEDPELTRAELRLTVAPAVAALPERQQLILHLRFFGNLTQDQIAQKIGISQMHVSRLLTRILQDLRRQLREPAAPVDRSAKIRVRPPAHTPAGRRDRQFR